MTKAPRMIITGTNCITAVGKDGTSTADSVFSGKAAIEYDESRMDIKGKPIKTAVIDGFDDNENDPSSLMARISEKCLIDLCDRYFREKAAVNDMYLFLGLSSEHRPGLRLDIDEPETSSVHTRRIPLREKGDGILIKTIERRLGSYAPNVHVKVFLSGNPSAIQGVHASEIVLTADPSAVCIVGGVDSLLSEDTLAWFEKDRRLVSESRGYEQGLFPSHAAGFFIVESVKGAAARRKNPMATIAGYHLNDEPDCFASGRPCRGEALTRNIRQVMDDIKPQVSTVDIVYCDLNGEYRRFREWSFADIRCFPRQSPRLVHPGDCFGDIGAAWVPVLAGIVSEGFERDMGKTAMIVCSDDYGKRGVMVLQKTETSKMVYSTRG